MIKNVIFDLDGTLFDTSAGIFESVSHTVRTQGLPELSARELRSFIGPPLSQSFQRVCGCSEEETAAAVSCFRTHYQAGAVLNARPYDGIARLCEGLSEQGLGLGIATNKPERFVLQLLRHFELEAFFDAVCCADESGKLKKADLILKCMQQLRGLCSDTLMVGDTDNDALGACANQVRFLAVTYGFGFSDKKDAEVFPCIGVAENTRQIAEIIASINRRE